MSSKNSETEHEFYRSSASRVSARAVEARAGAASNLASNDALDDRFIDLDTQDDSAFLRVERRVPVRRGALPKKTANRLKIATIVASVVAAVFGGLAALNVYAKGSPRFRVNSSDSILISGLRSVPRMQVMEVFGGDIGRNIFYVSLEERKQQLEEVPWIESAAVMRILPNRLKVDIRERTPVAFIRVGSKIALIDAYGVVLDLPAKAAKKYSFPVVVGLDESQPLTTRASRMKIYMDLMQQLDSGGGRYSNDVSEVDLSAPDDARITVADAQGAVLIHLGVSHPGEMAFLERYKIYLAHVRDWRAQFSKLQSVDLRYDRQVIVNPDAGKPPAPARGQGLSPPAKPPTASRPAVASRSAAKKRAPR